MKRIGIILAVLLAVVLLLILIAGRSSQTDGNVPQFVETVSQPVGPFGPVYYDWGDDVAFRGSKVWIFTALRTNLHEFLFDIEKRQVLGELLHAGAVFYNGDETKLLCEGPPAAATSLKQKLLALVSRLSSGKIKVHTNMVETFWILDLRHNSARKIGEFSQIPGSGSSWHPAPGFRYGYNIPSTISGDGEFFLCDLEKATLEKIRFPGQLHGWWDDHDLLMRDSAKNFVLFDVVTRKTSTVFAVDAIARRFQEMGIQDDAAKVNTRFSWNGKDYNVFFTGDKGGWSTYTNTTFLIKIERSNLGLKLLYSNFQFRWLGRLDATATHYLYAGENGRFGSGGNGGVFLLDLASNTTRTLVPPDNGGQYSLPRFYGDSVIYFTNREPWRIDLNGSNAVRLFPPVDK